MPKQEWPLEMGREAALAAAERGRMMEGVEIRKNDDGSIDEIIANGCTLHIEQMSDDGWFMGIDAADGSYWQFWFGSKNRRSHVEFRHTETVTAEEQAQKAHSTPEREG